MLIGSKIPPQADIIEFVIAGGYDFSTCGTQYVNLMFKPAPAVSDCSSGSGTGEDCAGSGRSPSATEQTRTPRHTLLSSDRPDGSSFLQSVSTHPTSGSPHQSPCSSVPPGSRQEQEKSCRPSPGKIGFQLYVAWTGSYSVL